MLRSLDPVNHAVNNIHNLLGNISMTSAARDLPGLANLPSNSLRSFCVLFIRPRLNRLHNPSSQIIERAEQRFARQSVRAPDRSCLPGPIRTSGKRPRWQHSLVYATSESEIGMTTQKFRLRRTILKKRSLHPTRCPAAVHTGIRFFTPCERMVEPRHILVHVCRLGLRACNLARSA